MKGCNGSCGRKVCPTPGECFVDDSPESLGRIVLLGLGIVAVVFAIALVVVVLV
jgi:hypothetical protein